MKWFLYAMSWIWIATGSWVILYTSESRKVLKNMLKGIDRKILSALPAIVGILLILSASASHNAWLLRLIGIMAVIKGGFIFLNPKNLYEEVTNWYLNSLSDQAYRLFGIFTIILGAAVLSWIL